MLPACVRGPLYPRKATMVLASRSPTKWKGRTSQQMIKRSMSHGERVIWAEELTLQLFVMNFYHQPTWFQLLASSRMSSEPHPNLFTLQPQFLHCNVSLLPLGLLRGWFQITYNVVPSLAHRRDATKIFSLPLDGVQKRLYNGGTIYAGSEGKTRACQVEGHAFGGSFPQYCDFCPTVQEPICLLNDSNFTKPDKSGFLFYPEKDLFFFSCDLYLMVVLW